MPDTNSTFQLREKDPADVQDADSADQLRIFWNVLTGMLAAKDSAGVVSNIGGSGGVPFIHNAVVLTGVSPYLSVVRETVKVNPAGGVVITLPTAVGNTGQKVKVINVTVDVTPINVNTQGGQTVDGAASPHVMITPRERVVLESDGANWVIVG